MRNRAPLITAIVLLLLPVLYVGSYLALSDHERVDFFTRGGGDQFGVVANYRYGARNAKQFFWPLEQIDRQLRPHTWSSRARLYVKTDSR